MYAMNVSNNGNHAQKNQWHIVHTANQTKNRELSGNGELMTRQDLIDLMESDAAIGIKDFMALHDQYITSMITHTQGYSHDQLEYIAAYVKFLEDHFMEDL
jgi:hypothetical protein